MTTRWAQAAIVVSFIFTIPIIEGMGKTGLSIANPEIFPKKFFWGKFLDTERIHGKVDCVGRENQTKETAIMTFQVLVVTAEEYRKADENPNYVPQECLVQEIEASCESLALRKVGKMIHQGEIPTGCMLRRKS